MARAEQRRVFLELRQDVQFTTTILSTPLQQHLIGSRVLFFLKANPGIYGIIW